MKSEIGMVCLEERGIFLPTNIASHSDSVCIYRLLNLYVVNITDAQFPVYAALRPVCTTVKT